MGRNPKTEGAGRDPRYDRSLSLKAGKALKDQVSQVICSDINAQLCRRASTERLVKLCDDGY